jgi:Type I phosphodiesterase / nucleotide pyrophosphatase
VLERWPDAWPNLARLTREGTSLIDAVVGSSPSITPATHSTLGTGACPRRHGVTAIEYRTEDGSVRQAFAGRNPADLRLTTMTDEIDLALNNEPKVGMLAWKGWHLGMLGHGTQKPGGDADEVGLIGTDEHITGNNSFYSTPSLQLVAHPLVVEQSIRAVQAARVLIESRSLRVATNRRVPVTSTSNASRIKR